MTDEMVGFGEELSDVEERNAAREHLDDLESSDEMLRAVHQLKSHPAGEFFVEMLKDILYDTSMEMIKISDNDLTNVYKGRCRQLKDMIELITESADRIAEHEGQKADAREAILDLEEDEDGNTH